MKEIIAIIRPEKHLPTIEAVMELGIEEIVDQRVLGRGREGGLRYLRPVPGQQSEEIVQFLPKRMLTWLIPEEKVGILVEAIMRTNRTSSYGDGKIFVCHVDGVHGNVEQPY
ncbi:MAG: P-II family nitrogen regulator [Chloroflexi bacterium]|nr:P-II family nitrogen regulator [Chloroflexota bacterium]